MEKSGGESSNIETTNEIKDEESEKVPTVGAVMNYVSQNIGNSHYLAQSIESNTYNIILCKFEQGQIYHGLMTFDSCDYEINFAIYYNNTSPIGYIKLINGTIYEKPFIQAITYNNQNYVSLCIDYSGAQKYMYLITTNCSDKNLIQVLINDEATPYIFNFLDTSTLLEVSTQTS